MRIIDANFKQHDQVMVAMKKYEPVSTLNNTHMKHKTKRTTQMSHLKHNNKISCITYFNASNGKHKKQT